MAHAAAMRTQSSMLMTHDQLQWKKAMQKSQSRAPVKGPEPPRDPCRFCVFTVVQSHTFERVIVVAVVLNALVLTSDYDGIEHDPLNHELYIHANVFFSCVYYVEATLKLAGLGP
eukprot:6205486-Prymnesium_polylepis.2